MGDRRDGMGTTGRTAGREKSGIHLTVGRETVGTETKYSVSRDSRRWEQRPSSGRGRKVAVGNERHSGFPFPSRPVRDPTTFSRPDHYRAYPW